MPEFVTEEFKALRKEMDDSVARLIDCERYALLATAAIWSWLVTQKPAMPELLLWLPLVVCFFFSVRGLGLILHIKDLGNHFVKTERHFGVPSALRFEKKFAHGYRKRVKFWSVCLFWPLLLIVTAFLPFLYLRLHVPEIEPCARLGSFA